MGPITSRSTPRPFSNLRHLAFRNCTLFASALRPASFPHLDTLSLGLVPDANMVFLGGAPRYDLDAITHTSRQFIEGVGPQLKALSLAPVILAKVLDLVPLLTSLIVLASPKPLDIMAETADLFAVVNSLPHPLPVLHVPRFIPWPSAQQFRGPHAPKVEVIVASARQLVPDDPRAAIGKAGVELRVEADLDFLHEVEALRRDATSAWNR